MTRSKFTIEFDKKYGDNLKDRKLSTLAKYFKIQKIIFQDVFNRGCWRVQYQSIISA